MCMYIFLMLNGLNIDRIVSISKEISFLSINTYVDIIYIYIFSFIINT